MKADGHGALILAPTDAGGNDAPSDRLFPDQCETSAGPSPAGNKNSVLVPRSVLNELAALAKSVDMVVDRLGGGGTPENNQTPAWSTASELGYGAAKLCAAVRELAELPPMPPHEPQPAAGPTIDRLCQLAQVVEASRWECDSAGLEFADCLRPNNLDEHQIDVLRGFAGESRELMDRAGLLCAAIRELHTLPGAPEAQADAYPQGIAADLDKLADRWSANATKLEDEAWRMGNDTVAQTLRGCAAELRTLRAGEPLSSRAEGAETEPNDPHERAKHSRDGWDALQADRELAAWRRLIADRIGKEPLAPLDLGTPGARGRIIRLIPPKCPGCGADLTRQHRTVRVLADDSGTSAWCVACRCELLAIDAPTDQDGANPMAALIAWAGEAYAAAQIWIKADQLGISIQAQGTHPDDPTEPIHRFCDWVGEHLGELFRASQVGARTVISSPRVKS